MTKARMETALDVLTLLFPAAVLLGNVIRFPLLEQFMIYKVTATRLVIDVATLFLLIRRLRRGKAVGRFAFPFLLFSGMMVFWILYGAAYILVSPLPLLWEGGAECFFLLQGLCVLYCLYELLESRGRVDMFFRGLRLSLAVMLLMAFWEAWSGRRISSSVYEAMPWVNVDGRWWATGLYQQGLYKATGNFYNQNNLAAALAVFSPLFFLTRGQRAWEMLLGGLAIAALVMLLTLVDANIALLGVAAALLVYCLVSRSGRWRKLATAGWTALLAARGAAVLNRLMVRGKARLFSAATAETLLERAGAPVPERTGLVAAATAASGSASVNQGLLNRIGGSILKMFSGQGEIAARMRIYRDAWEVFLRSRGLGVGPAAYTIRVQEIQRRSARIDPHNWWLEVLAKYGAAVFAAYVGSLLYLTVCLVRLHKKSGDERVAAALAMLAAMLVAVHGPSGYIGALYQWMVPGLCVALLRLGDVPAQAGDG